MRSSDLARSPTAPASLGTGLTAYGCEPDEAALFREIGPPLGAVPTITEAGLSEANAELARGTRCISVDHKTRVTRSVLLALRRTGVRYLSTRSIGTDHVDVDAASRLGICVENVVYSPDSVADYTVMLMVMAVRDARSVLARVDAQDYRLSDRRGRELRDLTVGVIGTGRIGSAVVERLRGFGCRIVAHDSSPTASVDYLALDDLLGQSDVVTLHTPLDAGTHHLLDRRRIERLKDGAVVVNTGRGPLVETEALLDALEAGGLGAAALDVVEGEEGIFYADRRSTPIENDALTRLQKLPNVILSPHTAYYTDHALRDAVENSVRSCLRFEAGRRHG